MPPTKNKKRDWQGKKKENRHSGGVSERKENPCLSLFKKKLHRSQNGKKERGKRKTRCLYHLLFWYKLLACSRKKDRRN